MIDNIQRKKLAERVLQSFYKKGIIPEYKDFISTIQNLFRFREYGKPFFSPRGAVRGAIVNPESLKKNIEEIKEDLSTCFEDLEDLSVEYLTQSSSVYSEYLSLRKKLNDLNEKLSIFLDKEYSKGIDILFDNFKSTEKIDLQKTTAYVNSSAGYASLPPSIKNSMRYYPSNITLIEETFPDKYQVVGEFIKVFNDYIDQVWQIGFDGINTYSAIVNLTGKQVIEGHSNEIEINRIVVDPISPMNLKIEGSTDGVNWFVLGNKDISSSYSFDFEACWVLFLKFIISGKDSLGIRRIEIGKTGTSSFASLVSKKFTSDYKIYNLDFVVDQEVPYGTSIEHYISTGGNNWSRIYPGNLKLGRIREEKINLSGEFIKDVVNDPSSLWKLPINSPPELIEESGKLIRGVGQVMVEAMRFSFDSYLDYNHIPDLSDWNSKLGLIYKSYMGSVGKNTGDFIPSEVFNKKSFVFNYVNSQEWWGIAIRHFASGGILSTNYNYKLTTYLYLSKDSIIDNFAGGIYIRDPNNFSLSPSVTNKKGWGWALYINSVKVASSNKFYGVPVPGSGEILPDQGVSFPISLRSGWNKIEVLLYIPSNEYLDPGLNGFNAYLLFRPNIFTFPVKNEIEKIDSPIWADGAPLTKVSEFYLKWNTGIWDDRVWAWRLDKASGVPTHILLNYNPGYYIDNTTIDGKFTGEKPNLYLSYIVSQDAITSLYYKAELKKEDFATAPPKIYSYRFAISR